MVVAAVDVESPSSFGGRHDRTLSNNCYYFDIITHYRTPALRELHGPSVASGVTRARDDPARTGHLRGVSNWRFHLALASKSRASWNHSILLGWARQGGARGVRAWRTLAQQAGKRLHGASFEHVLAVGEGDAAESKQQVAAVQQRAAAAQQQANDAFAAMCKGAVDTMM